MYTTMKTMKLIILGVVVFMTSLLTQSCEVDVDFHSPTWEYRHIEGEWIMTSQEYFYYDHGHLVDKEYFKYSKWSPGNDRNQMRLIIERDHSDYYFTAYHAGSYRWNFDSEYSVFIDKEGDMYRIISSPTHSSEEYIGHINDLSYREMELVYEGADYEVVTVYEKK